MFAQGGYRKKLAVLELRFLLFQMQTILRPEFCQTVRLLFLVVLFLQSDYLFHFSVLFQQTALDRKSVV